MRLRGSTHRLLQRRSGRQAEKARASSGVQSTSIVTFIGSLHASPGCFQLSRTAAGQLCIGCAACRRPAQAARLRPRRTTTDGQPPRARDQPYLLQHKHNPVDWWPWGRAALAEAQRTDKPILLSVGYAACHWCHVMAHESFEDDGDRGA